MAQQRAHQLQDRMNGADRLTQVGRGIWNSVGSALSRLGTFIRRSREEAAQQRKLQAQQQALSRGAAPTFSETIPVTGQEMQARINTFNQNPNREMNLILEGAGPYTLSWNTIGIDRNRVDHEAVAKRVNALGFPAGTFDADALTLSSISLLQAHQVVQALRPVAAPAPVQNAQQAGPQAAPNASPAMAPAEFEKSVTEALAPYNFSALEMNGIMGIQGIKARITALFGRDRNAGTAVLTALNAIRAGDKPAMGRLIIDIGSMPEASRKTLAAVPQATFRQMIQNPALVDNAATLGVTPAQQQVLREVMAKVNAGPPPAPARLRAVQDNTDTLFALLSNFNRA